MRRRDVLGLVAAGAAGGLAGCTGDGPGGGPTDTPEPTDTPTDTPTESPTATSTPEPEPANVTKRQFEVLDVQCGSGANTATVSHESTGEGTGRLTVEGVVEGSDTCHRARLVEAVTEGDRLRVVVESYVPEENDEMGCAECIVDIEYRATLAYEGSGPFDVVVEHDGQQVVESGPYPGSGDGGGGTVEYRLRPIR